MLVQKLSESPSSTGEVLHLESGGSKQEDEFGEGIRSFYKFLQVGQCFVPSRAGDKVSSEFTKVARFAAILIRVADSQQRHGPFFGTLRIEARMVLHNLGLQFRVVIQSRGVHRCSSFAVKEEVITHQCNLRAGFETRDPEVPIFEAPSHIGAVSADLFPKRLAEQRTV